jgi:hypothetical protein
MKNKILKEIETRKEIYKTSPSDMIAAYNREVETEKEYNGRQLLELLQNADDERSDEVQIALDTNKQTLTISNRGEFCTAFSFKGIRSLMISNLSSKTTKKYIGNKGLGFRSIINWSKQVTINSNGLDIVFSREIVDNVYNELFNEEEHKQIVKERDLPINIKPIPFLAIPQVKENPQDDWTTVVSIEYKNEFLEDIQKQLAELKNEILLFLNSIQRLEVVIDGEVKQRIDKKTLTDKWTIYSKNELLPKELWDKENEEEYFDLKIALQDDLENDVKELFAYFPTKIQINFPFIVHGTFELSSSRNGLNDSPKNRYILKKLVELIVETAKEMTQEEVSYKALEMLTYTNPNNILEKLGFYEAIDNAIEELEVFPCLDGKYRTMSDVVYTNELSKFIQDTGHNELFPKLIIPYDGDIDLNKYSLNGVVNDEQLNNLSTKIDNMDDRAELIYLLYNNFNVEDRLVFLIDSNENLIPLDDDVYTPSKLDFSIPNYVKIKFIHQELFEKLILKFGIVSNEKARDLQRKLKEITNIQSYEPAQVLQKIVTSTNKELEKDGVDQSEIIKKMVRSLYENYIHLEKTKIPTDTKVQLLNQNNTLTDAKNLFLSKTYPSGELTDYLFNDIFSTDEFLADIAIYDFGEDEEREDIEQFFLWLGVNRHTKFYYKTQVPQQYTNFVFKHVQKPVKYRDNSLHIKGISHFDEIIDRLSYEKIVLWFSLDEKIYTQLDNANNTDVFKYSKEGERYVNYSHTIYTKPSYILYQVLSSNIFKDYLVRNDKLSQLINEKKFNFDDKVFEKYEINKSDIESILLKIGAVDKFEKLSIDTVRKVLKELPTRSPEGKQTQTLYKLCIKHFEQHNTALNDEEIMLFAKKYEEKRYFPLKEVFYNGNIKLPKKITNTKAILNYPRRQSTTNVIGFFGINNLSSINIEVIQKDALTDITNEFNILFEQIKPFILVYRIQDIEVDQKVKNELSKLQNIHIKLCSGVKYKIDNEEFELDNNDYIRNENEYLVKIDSLPSLDELKSKFEFQESFADIIGLVFDIQDTKIFRDIIKEDPEYIEQIIRNDIGSDDLIRARELLGISDEYYSFWKTIYDLLGKKYEFKNTNNLLKLIKDDLELKADIGNIEYDHLNTYESCQDVKELFQELNVHVEDFNRSETAYYKIDCKSFHARNLKQAFENNLTSFKKYLYATCLKEHTEDIFIDSKGIYEHNDHFVHIQALEYRYKLDVNYNIIVNNFVNENFEFSDINMTNIDFEAIYNKHIEQINIEELKGNTKYLSLLYFKDTLEKIKEYIENENTTEAPISIDVPVRQPKPIIATTSTSQPVGTRTTIRKPRKPYKHPGDDGGKKARGNKSEKFAYDSLVAEYGKENIIWTAQDDDSLGYDMKYKNHDGVWKYVEVKTHSGKQFYISRNEKKFAEDHFGLYEIFLVGDEIYKFTDVDFSDNSTFTVIENEFIVFYELEEKI